MILNREHVLLFVKYLTSLKKVSRLNVTEDDIVNYFTTINYINSLDKDELQVEGKYPLSSYKILKPFSDLIVPSTIKLETAATAVNFLSAKYSQFMPISSKDVTRIRKVKDKPDTVEEYKVTLPEGEVLSPTDFDIINNGIAGTRRAATVETVSVDTLHIEKKLTEVQSLIIHEDSEYCRLSDSYIVPIMVSTDFRLKSYYNLELGENFKEWLDKSIKTLG